MPDLSSAEEKQLILQRLEDSRQGLRRHQIKLKHSLDVKARVKESIRQHPTRWAGAAATAGLFAAKSLFGRKKKQNLANSVAQKSTATVLLGLIFSMLRPTLQSVVTEKLRALADQHRTRP